MSMTVPFQVGSWVTLKAASKRSRDRQDAQTPALITAISIEGEGYATVLFPNPLALQFGFGCQGWKRTEGMPLNKMKAHKGTPALEAALLAALRSQRLGTSLGERETRQKRALERPEMHELAKAQKTGLFQWLRASEDGPGPPSVSCATELTEPPVSETPAGPEVPEQTDQGLRQWMKPGSVWEIENDPLTSLRSTTQPFRRPSTGLQAWIKPQKAREEFFIDAVEETTETPAEGPEEAPAESPEEASARLEPSPATEPAPTEMDEAALAETSGSDGSCLTSPPSPQSPMARPSATLAWTLSPLKTTATKPRFDESLLKFTSMTARAFADKRSTQLPKLELFEYVKRQDMSQEYSLDLFETQIQRLDALDKVAAIDGMVFSLA
jgi:hypothetical protein